MEADRRHNAFSFHIVETLPMRWFTRGMWKATIAIAGVLLFLVLMVWVPMATTVAHEIAPGLAMSITVKAQATPTEDATVAALNKEKLAQEVQQLKNQNESDPLGWLRTNISILLSTLVVVIGALFGLWRWRVDRRDAQNKESKDRQAAQDKELEDRKVEREKRAEERFQSVVEGLSSEREEAKVGAAIMLRTFLRPGYEQFYTQTFDLAVAHLRLPRAPQPPEDVDTPLPLSTLRQALIMVFKEAFPLARNLYPSGHQPLVARGIRLDSAYLEEADLKQAWMPQASLREADVRRANLTEAILTEANLTKAGLTGANLAGANLAGALQLHLLPHQ